MRRWALVLLCACTGSPGAGTADGRALREVGQAWDAADGLPRVGPCLDHVEIVRHAGYDEFKTACASPFAAHADPRVLVGCTTDGMSANPWQSTNNYYVRIAPLNMHEHETIQHEACHVIIMCTGLHPDGDPHHTDPRVWASGGADSVQARANSLAL